MTIEEFNKRTQSNYATQEEYALIEEVYKWHPSIGDTERNRQPPTRNR